jgi:hypothetical protein
MANTFREWLKHVWRGPFIRDLPPELAQCEDGCSEGECRQSKWVSCEKRIRRMHEEIRLSRKPGDDSAAT